jgi:nitrile hydratase subunit beta
VVKVGRGMASGEWAVGSRRARRGSHSGLATLHSRFLPGDAIRVADHPVLGHCRTPGYLRGKTGMIASIHGTFRDPESLAYHKPGLPAQVLYKVRFRQRDIWAGYTGPADDQLEADIFEHWLEPLEGEGE